MHTAQNKFMAQCLLLVTFLLPRFVIHTAQNKFMAQYLWLVTFLLPRFVIRTAQNKFMVPVLTDGYISVVQVVCVCDAHCPEQVHGPRVPL